MIVAKLAALVKSRINDYFTKSDEALAAEKVGVASNLFKFKRVR